MTYSINKNKALGSILCALALVFVVAATPATTHANISISFGPGNGSSTRSTSLTLNKSNPITLNYTSTRTNSGNINVTFTNNKTVTQSNPTPYIAYDYSSNNSYGCDYDCGSYGYYPPVYTPPAYTYPTSYPVVSPLYVSCYSEPLSAQVGSTVVWTSSVSGGTGSYSYSWSGSNGYLGNSSSVSTVYYNAGTYNAYLTVTSGGQSQSVNCNSSVSIYGSNYYNNGYYNNYNNYGYASLQVSCTPSVTYTSVGSSITWSATAYGGNGGYSYSWTGTDGLYGYGQYVSISYNNPGYKTATVTVTSNGQSITQTCSNSVNVGGYQTVNNGTYYNQNNTNNGGLDIGCYADPVTASINQPVTWTVEVTGGVAPYTYSWSGTDGLSGANASITKYYDAYGSKSAIVSVTSADGKTGTRACSNAVAVRGPGGNGANGSINNGQNNNANPATSTNANQTNNSQSAAALFSLQNVPWGWIAILIILVLFATILYLVFNRPTI